MNLKQYIEENPKLVKARQSIRYPDLYVVKYTHKVFYDGLWTPELEECRGLVVDKDFNIVVRPFKKIYNRFERGTDFSPDTRVTAVRKVNGFMAAVTVHKKHGVIISTTGSLDSDFVSLARSHLEPEITYNIDQTGHDVTWLFEICSPNDPHIIKEEPGAYLIGGRSLRDGEMFSETLLDEIAEDMGAKRPMYYAGLKFSTVCQMTKDCVHEGYVVHGPDKTLKMKSPYYLINKFLARKKGERLIDLLSDIPSLRKTVPEEYYPLLDHLEKHIEFPGMDEAARLTVIQKFLTGEAA